MRGLVGSGTLAVLLGLIVGGIVVGCSNSPPPIKVAAKVGGDTEDQEAPAISVVQKPEKSDPVSLAVVEAAVKAHTGGKPELLQLLKSVTATREGLGSSNTIDRLAQRWRYHMIWPGKIRIHVDFLNSNDYATFAVSGDTFWIAATKTPTKQVADAKLAADMILDMSAEWFLLLFPLTEPTTIFAPAQDGFPNGKPATGVRVWAKGITDAVLYFDKETKLLGQVRFDGREAALKVTKDVLVFVNKPFAGVLLPERIEVRSNGRYIFDWTQTEFLANQSIDPKVFENP